MWYPIAINDFGFVVGEDHSGDTKRVARWHPSLGKEVFLDLKMNEEGEVNAYNEFGAVIHPGAAPGSGTPCRIGNQIDWIGDTSSAYIVSAVNDSGDVGYVATVSSNIEKAYFYHASQNQVFAIDQLVSDEFLNSNDNDQWPVFLTNRVSSLDLPTPVITGRVYNTATNDRRIYFLFPEDPPPVLTWTYS